MWIIFSLRTGDSRISLTFCTFLRVIKLFITFKFKSFCFNTFYESSIPVDQQLFLEGTNPEGISKARVRTGIGAEFSVGIWVSAMIPVRAIPVGIGIGIDRPSWATSRAISTAGWR